MSPNETVQLIQTFINFVTPAGILVFTAWFLKRDFWPWWVGKRADYQHELELKRISADEAVGQGITSLASAITFLAECIERGKSESASQVKP